MKTKTQKLQSKTDKTVQKKLGPGAETALFKFLSKRIHRERVRGCKCENASDCIHQGAIYQFAWESFLDVTADFRQESSTWPAEVSELRVEIERQHRCYEKLKAAVLEHVPLKKRGRLRGLLERYEEEYFTFYMTFGAAVGFVKGVNLYERKIADLMTTKVVGGEIRESLYAKAYLAHGSQLHKRNLEQHGESKAA
jgi:hypothetical protein